MYAVGVKRHFWFELQVLWCRRYGGADGCRRLGFPNLPALSRLDKLDSNTTGLVECIPELSFITGCWQAFANTLH